MQGLILNLQSYMNILRWKWGRYPDEEIPKQKDKPCQDIREIETNHGFSNSNEVTGQEWVLIMWKKKKNLKTKIGKNTNLIEAIFTTSKHEDWAHRFFLRMETTWFYREHWFSEGYSLRKIKRTATEAKHNFRMH